MRFLQIVGLLHFMGGGGGGVGGWGEGGVSFLVIDFDIFMPKKKKELIMFRVLRTDLRRDNKKKT